MTANIVFYVCSFVYLVISVVNAASSTKLPKGFIQCSKSSPDFDECLRNSLQLGIPHLAIGVPSLGIVKIDPLRISVLEIDQGTGPVQIKLKFKDIDILNIKHIKVDKIHYDLVNNSIHLDLHNPKSIILEGDYEVSGKVLILPIIGKGKCKISLDVSSLTVDVHHKYFTKNGNTYFKIEKLILKFIPTKLFLRLDNLFNGDKALGDNMNVFLNENWSDILKELQPAIEEVLNVAFTEIAQQFLNRVPSNQIFLD